MDPFKLSIEDLLYLRLKDTFDQLDGARVPGLYRTLVDQVDRAVLRHALERASGRVHEAAAFLGLDRNTLARKLKRLRLETGKRRTEKQGVAGAMTKHR